MQRTRLRTPTVTALALILAASVTGQAGKAFRPPIKAALPSSDTPSDGGSQFSASDPSTWYSVVWTGRYGCASKQDAGLRKEGSGGHPGVDIRGQFASDPAQKKAGADLGIYSIGDGVLRFVGVSSSGVSSSGVSSSGVSSSGVSSSGVSSSGVSSSWGNFVVVEHQGVVGYGKLYSVYAHLEPDDYFTVMKSAEPCLKKINAGDRLGTMGTSGGVPLHLHFQVDQKWPPGRMQPFWPAGYPSDDDCVDPEKWAEFATPVKGATVSPMWLVENGRHVPASIVGEPGAYKEAFAKAYRAAGAAAKLGCASGPVLTSADGSARQELDNGCIEASPGGGPVVLSACSRCPIAIGAGASPADGSAFRAAYDEAGGQAALGCASTAVLPGFKSFSGVIGTYQTLEKGLLAFNSGKVYALLRPVSDKWRRMGFRTENLLGYPTSQLSEEKTASTGTRYRFQQFEGGALEWHVSGPKAGQVFEVHGAILERWATLGYADWSGGLPTADEGRPGLGSGLGRMSQFEGGYIWWKQGAPEAVETEPPISDLYVRLRGGAGWLGFPRSRVWSAADGSLRQDFEHGYIQVLPGKDPEARRSDCTYELREDSVDVRPTGAMLAQVRATVPKECPFEARPDVPWIRVLMVTHIGTSGRVQFTVGANPGTARRTGTLTVGDRTVTVRQAGAQPRP